MVKPDRSGEKLMRGIFLLSFIKESCCQREGHMRGAGTRRRRVSDYRSEETRKRIAAAMQNLLRKKGLREITVGEITRKAAMSRKSFYYHFACKEQLAEWMMEDDLNENILCERIDDTWDAVEIVCRHVHEKKAFYRGILSGGGASSFSELLTPLFLDLTGKKNEGDEFASFLASGLTIFLSSWLLSEKGDDPDKVLAQLRRSIIRLSESSLRHTH